MSKSKKHATEPAPRFEDAIEQVETIIAEIESGEVDLEKCLVQYETGVKLLKHCQTVLQRAEQKIAELTADDAGNLSVEDEVEAAPTDETSPN